MSSDRSLLLAGAILAAMLITVGWPTWQNLSGLWVFSTTYQGRGIALSDLFTVEIAALLVLTTIYAQSSTGTGSTSVIRRFAVLAVLILAQLMLSLFAAGFLVHQDAAWYQILRGQNEIMPATAVIVMACYPGYLLFGGGAYLYAKNTCQNSRTACVYRSWY
jgi:hypothetical protein